MTAEPQAGEGSSAQLQATLGTVLEAIRLPVDCNTDNIDTDQKPEAYTNFRSPDSDERDAKRRKIEEAVKENIEQAQQKQKKNIMTGSMVPVLHIKLGRL